MSELKAKLMEAMKDAMRAQDKERLGVIRMATAALKQIEVDERVELDDARVLATLEKLIKSRRESAAAFEAGGRPELAAKENAEIVVLQSFLPAQLSEGEIDALVAEAIAETGAASARDMGKVMNVLRPKLAGRADTGAVSQKVKARLG
ncbi:MAG TPA: GatB/YqeY domain-containing protein [Moraxellaceae bacterium]|nr:GatB/YqeY domain-containing protein [Moraxellaceae bacterium]